MKLQYYRQTYWQKAHRYDGFPHLLPGALPMLFAQVSRTGKLTLADRYGLMAALLDDSLEDEERASIDRLLRGIRLRRMQIVNDLSMIAHEMF